LKKIKSKTKNPQNFLLPSPRRPEGLLPVEEMDYPLPDDPVLREEKYILG
jgi:hypothetical protein